MPQPLITGRAQWDRHVARATAVVTMALDLLSPQGRDESEDDLNRQFYHCLLDANRKLVGTLLGAFDYAPIYEGRNLPSPDHPEQAARELKRPDFYWSILDHSAPNPRQGVRTFVLECKRLGTSTRSSWPLNENYVRNGIVRFIGSEHGYARDDDVGAMVGYVQNMEFTVIFSEVNAIATLEKIPVLELPAGGWRPNGTSHMAHLLERSEGVKSFNLHHYWVDLRSRWTTPKAPSMPGTV